MTIEDFYEQMLIFFPKIEYEISTHDNEYDQRLDTIVVEEIIMPQIINLLKENKERDRLKKIFEFFENVVIQGDKKLINVFSVTVLEILGNDIDILEKAKKYMGHKTTVLQREADINLGRKSGTL